MSSRAVILEKLSQKKHLFESIKEARSNIHVVPNLSDKLEEMLARFIVEAEKISCIIHQVADEKGAVEEILSLLDGEMTVLGWAFDQIALPGLEDALKEQDIHLDKTANPEIRYGITGADAALAATGSIVLSSGTGKSRAASLLPPIHIAVLRSNQIVKDLESWISFAQKKKKFQNKSNTFIISGPSKTADIAMELVMGMHGPQELHFVLIKS